MKARLEKGFEYIYYKKKDFLKEYTEKQGEEL